MNYIIDPSAKPMGNGPTYVAQLQIEVQALHDACAVLTPVADAAAEFLQAWDRDNRPNLDLLDKLRAASREVERYAEGIYIRQDDGNVSATDLKGNRA